MIGVIGPSNAGKSTLVNAILGEMILPQSYKCSTPVVTHVSLDDVEKPLLSHGGKDVEGGKEIHRTLKAMSKEARESDETEVREVFLSWKPNPTFTRPDGVEVGTDLTYDGTLQLVDIPGVDETDNEVVKKCLDQLLSECHGLWILTKYDAVMSDGLERLLTHVAKRAPRLFVKGAMCFVITQADNIRNDVDSDEEDDEAPSSIIDDLKNELKRFLTNRFPKHEEFLKHVEILATSIDQELRGGHDFFKLFEVMSRTPKFHCKEHRASATGEAIEKRQVNCKVWTVLAVGATVVTIPLGGVAILVGGAIRGAAAAVGALVAVFSGAMVIRGYQAGDPSEDAAADDKED